MYFLAKIGDQNATSHIKSGNTPKIIYASRTHSQLAQVVNELKATSYRPKMSLLGSREQLCIHPNISKLRGSVLNHACNSINSSDKKCKFKYGVNTHVSDEIVDKNIRDIEDLIKYGITEELCPYYYSREYSEDADLILLPYNYLIDESIRKTLKGRWENSIVIFDEAHNLERVASDAASFTWTSLDISQCIVELKKLLAIFQQRTAFEKTSESSSSSSSSSTEKLYPTIEQVMYLLKCMFKIEEKMDSIPLSKNSGMSIPSCVFPGDWLVSMLEECGFSCVDAHKHVDALQRCTFMIMDEFSNVLGGLSPLSITEPKLTHFCNSLRRVFRHRIKQENSTKLIDYKTFICEGDTNKSDNRYNISTQNRPSKPKRVLNFWAFSSGIAMEELAQLGIRSFLLTSGTMSPMESFKEDLKIRFPICIQNPHVIENKQIWIGAFGSGTQGKLLNSSYNTAQTSDYKDDLGESILKICQAVLGRGAGNLHGPELKGGILVFFPSYTSMESLVKRWKETSLFQKLKIAGGDIVIEPKGNTKDGGISNRVAALTSANDTKKVGGGFGDDIKKPKVLDDNVNGTNGNSDEKMLAGVVTEFETALKSKNRCLLFAVCRGKVSEGIDFYDEKGRVVIITGLPYAPYLDPWVVLKKNYMDERCNKVIANQLMTPITSTDPNKTSTSYSSVSNSVDAFMSSVFKPSSVQFPLQENKPSMMVPVANTMPPPASKSAFKLDGKAWYDQSASRAVNQAIGRVIRHRKDWGAIFLLDDRFLKDSQKAQLSGWVKGRLVKYNQFGAGLEGFRKFITDAMNDPDLNIPGKNVVIKPMKEENKIDDSAISRTIVIHRSDLIEEEDNSFLDPEKLLTQNIEARARFDIAYDDNDDDLDDMVSKIKRNSSFNDNHSNFNSGSSNSSNSNSSSLKRSLSTDKKGTLTSIFARGDCNNQSCSNLTKIVPLKKATPFVMESISSTMKGSKSSNESRSEIFGLGSSSLSSSSSLTSTSLNTFQTRENDKIVSNMISSESDNTAGNNLLTIIGDIRSSLHETEFLKFKNIIKTTKENNGGLKQLAQIEIFVNGLIPLFSKVDPEVAEKLMLRLSILIPPNFMDLKEKFKTLVLKVYRKKDSVVEKENVPSQMVNDDVYKKRPISSNIDKDNVKQFRTNNNSSAQIIVQGNTQSQSNLVLHQYTQLSQGVPSSQSTQLSQGIPSSQSSQSFQKPNKEEDFRNLKSLWKPTGRSQKMVEASLGNTAIKSSKDISTKSFLCVICKGVPESPCAAKLCGHICCSTCWIQWLKVKQQCPYCKKPATISNLTKIILQR